MSFTSKIRIDHFIEQVRMAAEHEGQKDELIKMALEVFADRHHDESDPTDTFALGFLVTELMGTLSDHLQDQIQELEASESQLDNRVDELEEVLETIGGIVERTI